MKKVMSFFLVFLLLLCVSGSFLACANNNIDSGIEDKDGVSVNDESNSYTPSVHEPTEGLRYSLMNDDTYGICGYEGDDRAVYIPDTYKNKPVSTIYENAFKETSITLVSLPNSIREIEASAFANCVKLTSVTIGSGVTSIGDRAFYKCSGLTDIHYGGTKAQWNAVSKGSYWNYNTGKYTVHCTDGNIK
jgi:hypothetical protein